MLVYQARTNINTSLTCGVPFPSSQPPFTPAQVEEANYVFIEHHGDEVCAVGFIPYFINPLLLMPTADWLLPSRAG